MTLFSRLETVVKKKVYASITIISTVLGVIGGATQAYAFFQGQAEGQQRREEEARKSEREKLQDQITYAKSILPECNFGVAEENRVSSVLERAERELILNDDTVTSKALFETVKDDLVSCGFKIAPLERSPALMVAPVVGAFAIAGVFGFLWNRTKKRPSQTQI